MTRGNLTSDITTTTCAIFHLLSLDTRTHARTHAQRVIGGREAESYNNGDQILDSVSSRPKLRIHSLEQIAGTNLQAFIRYSSLQSNSSLSRFEKKKLSLIYFLLNFILQFSQFNIPNLRVGTLDSLLSLSDDLVKVKKKRRHSICFSIRLNFGDLMWF